ncbi:hypothetical protein [Vandammella animalimorsus]|uniref:Uncharacterized protein n=1 Tax=Vandammella animalimorsus TaxID=2029117 RepID=A0A2A2ABI8_9BURK|nr:hypothetical protein [Vandammella animalimorsus]PAT34949.1 hypothetical protein CK625_12580 [Vandammella animalimorsus]
MRFLKPIAWIFSVALVCAGAWFGRKVPFVEQWPLFEALRTTAAIIFAVIGAWMAIVYPERLRFSLRKGAGGRTPTGDASSELFTPVVNSTCILAIVLLIGIVAPLVRAYGFGIPAELGRGLSYALLVALTLWQLWTVFLTLGPADSIKSDMDREKGRRSDLDVVAGKNLGP